MSKSKLSAPRFHDEAAAFCYLEGKLWPQGPVCPKCGGEGYALKGVKDKKGRERHGLKKCRACRAQFTVRMGTVFEASHVPLHLWLQAVALLAASKKGISSNQLHRTLGVTLKTAWFMSHRIREAMRSGSLTPPKMGSGGGAVEADETFYSKSHTPTGATGMHAMGKVLSLVERATGEARSFVVVDLNKETLWPILQANIAREARLMTDEANYYRKLDSVFPAWESVNHRREEWARGDVSTNTVEGFYSIFKRGMRGVYQHCQSKHLHRYAAEFDFRYTNRVRVGVDDQARADLVLKGVVGKRLTYQTARKRAEARPW